MDAMGTEQCRSIVGAVKDGFVFEGFSKQFLSAVLGHSFIPVGGVGDRGIDGFQHAFCGDGFARTIYQTSIEKDSSSKTRSTLKRLAEGNVEFDRLVYVTNRVVKDKDRLIDALYLESNKQVMIYDLEWFCSNVNSSAGTLGAVNTLVAENYHRLVSPDSLQVMADLIGDARLYVFLRQQWESGHNLHMDELLADTLILHALEATDPDRGIVMTEEQILSEIARHIFFEPKLLRAQIKSRLKILSTKPRRIKYHTQAKGYCLPYETRVEIRRKGVEDAALHTEFMESVSALLANYLTGVDASAPICANLVEETLNKLFHRQGLEFADLIMSGQNLAFEKSLPETVSEVIDASTKVPPRNREAVKYALMQTLREITYNGTPRQTEFLRRLSNTYMLLFLLQCDPKLAIYFDSMASRLIVYVCTSIIIPALSEVYLSAENRRYWNLLLGAKQAGVELRINDGIVEELAAHFRMLKNTFRTEYEGNEEIFADETTVLYVKEIMLRAYFYAKMRGRVQCFDEFLDNFLTPTMENSRGELISFLEHEFGFRFVSDRSLGIKSDPNEQAKLVAELATHKSNKQAQLDANLILTIFSLREMNNEAGGQGIFGYVTWWLSTDVTTQKAVNKVFGHKYEVSCYMRPDFLYNYISLAPHRNVVDEVYGRIFPSLLGVNISNNLPQEVLDFVHKTLRDHHDKPSGRVKAILSQLSNKLKTDPTYASRRSLEVLLDTTCKEIAAAGK